jgi:hypothetical protein
MLNRTIELPSGLRVQLYRVVSVSAGGPRSYGVQYASAFPITDTDGRRQEAEEVIRYFAHVFDEDGARFASAQVCSTEAQAAARERPEQVFGFESTAPGSWRYTGELVDPLR